MSRLILAILISLVLVCSFSYSLQANSDNTTVDLTVEVVPPITGQVEVTIPPGETDYEVDATDIADTTITVSTLPGLGDVTVTVKKYASNPHPTVALPASMLPRYIDIEVDNPDAVDWPMLVEQTYTDAEVAGLNEAALGMYYFKTGAWHRCSDTGVNTTTNTIWAKMTKDEVSGSPVAIGGAAAAAPAGGTGGGPPPLPRGTTDVRGKVSTAGVFFWSVTAISEDRLYRLTIPKGTVGLTEELEPLTKITTLIMDEPPPLPEGAHVIGLVYDFQPSGATFEPPVTLKCNYDPSDIPDGIAEGDLVIAYYDEDAGKWVELDCVVDTENNTITASISHFTGFAIIGAVPAPPPPPPAPAIFSVTTLSIQPAEVQPKELVTITVSVVNTGGTESSYTVVLKINAVKEAEKSVTIAAGKSQDVSFSASKEDAGRYSVDVDGLSGSFTVVAPAAFLASNLSVQPAQVESGEAVTVSVSLANTGGESGSYTVTLKINGVKEAEKSVTIAAGGSQTVTFSVTREEAGSYSVDVDRLSGSFTVVIPPLPAKEVNWPLVGAIIAGVVAAGLVGFFLIRRRAH